VSFDLGGELLVADGTQWVSTGKNFRTDTWYEATLRLDFTNHTYDVFFRPFSAREEPLVSVKTELKFIDPSKNSWTTFRLGGGFSTTQSADSHLDDVRIHYIEGLRFLTPAYTLLPDQPAGPITVQLQDSLRGPQRATEDILLELRSSSPGGKFSLQREPWADIASVLMPKDSTSVSFYYKDNRVGRPLLSVDEFPDRGWTLGLQEQKVIAQEAHLEVLATSPQIAGVPFAVTITARDEDGNLDDGYAGEILLQAAYVSPDTGTLSLFPIEASGFANGKLQLTLTYPDAGSIRIVASDKSDSRRTGASGQILFTPAKFQVEADATQVVSRPFPLTVTALNQSGAVTPNYQGSVNLGVAAIQPATGTGEILPAGISAETFKEGRATLEGTYPRWGTILLTAADATAPEVKGQTQQLKFHPASIEVVVSAPPAPRNFFYTGEGFTITISTKGADNLPIANYLGKVDLAASSALSLPANYSFISGDGGVHSFNLFVDSAGRHSLQATDSESRLASPTVTVEIKQALIKVVDTSGPVGGATEVEILLVDEKGNIIEDSTTNLNVKLKESNPNHSVSSTVLSQPIRLSQGRAKFLLADTEEESVEVDPSSVFGIKVQKGTVRFGRFATRGVGVLFWKEIGSPSP